VARPIDRREAEVVLRAAYDSAINARYDKRWVDIVNEVWDFSSKTYVAAFGTILLAKSVDEMVDVGTIKVLEDDENPNTFSLRTLGHAVLVPLSRELDFSIRTTGREPLNNQPFFRYSHINDIDRVGNPRDLARYKEILFTELRHLTVKEAREALAAFVSVGLKKRDYLEQIASAEGALSAGEVLRGVELLLTESGAGPWVVQALGAVFLTYITDEIVTRKLNDPSRNFPGDVQGISAGGDFEFSLEARNKPVSVSDALAFAESCARHSIRKAVILELTGQPTSLPEAKLISEVWKRSGVALLIIDNISDLISISATLGKVSVEEFYDEFARILAEQLAEVEAPEQARIDWADYVEGGE